jgi:hypothetical protein
MTKNLQAKILMKLLKLLTKSLGFYAFFLMIRSDRNIVIIEKRLHQRDRFH